MSEFTRNLIEDLTELLKNSDEYNIKIIVGEDKSIQTFQAHSIVLRARSPYFRRALSKEWAKKEGAMMVFKKPNISPKIFELILNIIDLDKENGHHVLSLLIAADELEIDELINHAQEFLITKMSTWVQQNLVKIMHTVDLHESFKRLNEYCDATIREEPHMFFKSGDFLSLKEHELVSLLKCDNLAMDEIEVWNSIIKWGTKNTSNLGNQPISKWTPQYFASLEQTLHQCIPLIRYSDISSNDYFEKVIPYRRILPKDIKMEMLGYHLKNSTPQPIKILPPRSGSIDSKIISSKHINDGNVKFSRSVSGNQIAYNPYQITYGPYFYNDLLIGDQCDQNASSWYRPCLFNTPNNNIWDDNNAFKYFQVDEFE
ncbi:6123_t:CDS:2, partial [Ambispora gerdemannii]